MSQQHFCVTSFQFLNVNIKEHSNQTHLHLRYLCLLDFVKNGSTRFYFSPFVRKRKIIEYLFSEQLINASFERNNNRHDINLKMTSISELTIGAWSYPLLI